MHLQGVGGSSLSGRGSRGDDHEIVHLTDAGLQQPLVVSALLPALLFVGTSLWLPLRRLYRRNPAN